MANINSIGNNPDSRKLAQIVFDLQGFNLDRNHQRLKSATFWGRPGAVDPFHPESWLGGAELLDEERATLSKAVYVVFSYDTPIAWLMADGRWMAPTYEYSPTTRQHIFGILHALAHNDVKVDNLNLIRL